MFSLITPFSPALMSLYRPPLLMISPTLSLLLNNKKRKLNRKRKKKMAIPSPSLSIFLLFLMTPALISASAVPDPELVVHEVHK